MQSSISEVSQQLAIAKSDAENYKKSAIIKQKEIDALKETFNMDSQLQQNQSMDKADKFSTEVKMLRSENALLQDELRRAKESVQKTPPNVMGSLVDKLRNDISEKEKKIRAMGRIIADLKTELVDNAVARERKDNVDSGNMLDLDEARRRIEDLTDQNENLNKQIEVLKSKQVSSYAEIKHLKEEIAKKGSLLVKLKEDKMKRPGGPGAAKDRSPGPVVKSASSDREKEEHQIEQQVDQDDVEKRIKTAAELARWDESKRWQHKIEILKNRLTEADGEVSKLSKTNNSLREMVSRLEREKVMLETSLRTKTSGSSVKSNINEIKLKELQMENGKLREELEATRHDFMMQGTQGLETLKMRNKFLQGTQGLETLKM